MFFALFRTLPKVVCHFRKPGQGQQCCAWYFFFSVGDTTHLCKFAAVVAAVENGYCKKNTDITVKVRGGDLIVNYSDEGVYLTGAIKLVFEGSVEY